MATYYTSKSAFLNAVSGQASPKPPADQPDPAAGGPAISDMEARRGVLKQTPQPSPFINAVPKFSSGPRSRQDSFPGKSKNERKAP